MRHLLVETGMEKNQLDFFVENHRPPSGGMWLYILVDLPVVALVRYAESAAVNFAVLGEECFADKAYNAVADVQIGALVPEPFVNLDSVVFAAPVAEAFAALDALVPGAFADLDAASFAHAFAWPVPIVNLVVAQLEPPAVEQMMSQGDSSVVSLDVHAVEKIGPLAFPAVVELVLSAGHPETPLHLVALNEERKLQPALVW